MASAINALIRDYFIRHYPMVTKAFKKDSAPIDEARKEHVFKQSSLEALICNTNRKRKRDDNVFNSRESSQKDLKEAPVRMASCVDSKRSPMSGSSDDEEPVGMTVSKRVSRNGAVEDMQSSLILRRQGSNNHRSRSGPSYRMENGSHCRFHRIDPTKVEFYDNTLRDNLPGPEHMVLRQNQEMMRVKGKNFNKLKQKNKGKFYGVGVDFSVRSYQFPDSDDD